jgi:hypothetical protein
MRYQPYEDEYAAVPGMTDEEILEYFLYRIFETDEVWGLKQGQRWLTREIDGQETLLVWPYKRYADEAAVADWQGLSPVADSLDYFIYQVLNKVASQGLMIEIMPRNFAAGCLIKPQRLFGFLDNMKDSRDFVLDD